MEFYTGATNNNALYLTGSGGVGIGVLPDQLLTVNGGASKPGGGSWVTYSDLRLKTVPIAFQAGLKEILKLTPIRYRYREDNLLSIPTKDEHIGLSAQQVRDAIPDAVSENKSGYLMLNNDPVIFAMLNAIKEQPATIEDLRKRITQLEGVK